MHHFRREAVGLGSIFLLVFLFIDFKLVLDASFLLDLREDAWVFWEKFIFLQINFWEKCVTFKFLHDPCHKESEVAWLVHGFLVNRAASHYPNHVHFIC